MPFHPLVNMTLAGLATATSLACQATWTSPEALANTSTRRFSTVPWGGHWGPQQFYQQIHDDLQGRRLRIRGMAFRNQWLARGGRRCYTMALKLGRAATRASSMSARFANNWHTDSHTTTVLDGRVSFPPFQPSDQLTSDFPAGIDFSTPYVYYGRYPLMWQVHVTSITPLTQLSSYEFGPAISHSAGPIGSGCRLTNRSLPLKTTGYTTANRLSESLMNGPTSGLPLVAFGDIQDSWGGQSLPVSLGFAGSPDCFVNINVRFYVPADNSQQLRLTCPNWTTALAGTRFRTQWAVADGGRLRTSNGLDHSIPFQAGGATSQNAWPTRSLYASGISSPPPTGTLLAGGLVTQFRL